MTVRASQNLVLFKIFGFVRTIHVFSSKGCYVPKFWVQNRTGCLWLLWAELPRNSFISVWHPHPVTVHSPSEIAVWALCSGGCFLRKKSHKQTKKPLMLPSDQSAWSTAGDGASPGILHQKSSGLGTCFPRWGNSLPKTKPPVTEETETSTF